MESSNNLGLNLSTHPIVTDSSYNLTSSPNRNTFQLLCERLCPGGYLQAPSTIHHLPGECFIHLGAQLGAHILKTLPVQGHCTHFSHSFKSRGQFFDPGFQHIGTRARINILTAVHSRSFTLHILLAVDTAESLPNLIRSNRTAIHLGGKYPKYVRK